MKIRRDAPLWANFVEGQKFVVDDFRATIGRPTDRGRWGMTPPTSNAYYNPLLNEIVLPAGILQPPAFDLAATDAVNDGAIGAVIGHEVSHGFDDQGAQFDAQGRLLKPALLPAGVLLQGVGSHGPGRLEVRGLSGEGLRAGARVRI